MKTRILACALALATAVSGTPAFAKKKADDAVGQYLIDNVMKRPDAAPQLEGVRFHFASSPGGRRIQQNVTVSLRTRKFGRSPEEACQWVMMSALLDLKRRAQAVGGNAVVNIRSNWQNVEFRSATEYQCATGGLMAGVALKADIVAR